jgi:hypothetical protein
MQARSHHIVHSCPRASIRASAAPRSYEPSRRALLVNLAILPPLLLNTAKADEESASVKIINDTPGIGTHAAIEGDLLLIHYVGKLESSGQIFDSTRGGLEYRDGGIGVFRPAIVELGNPNPTPGLVKGLKDGLMGMKVGGKRTLLVAPSKGFGGQVVGAPYAVVPVNSTLLYEVELLRLSNRGPDELTRGISRCGAGGASASSEACNTIEIKEFV